MKRKTGRQARYVKEQEDGSFVCEVRPRSGAGGVYLPKHLIGMKVRVTLITKQKDTPIPDLYYAYDRTIGRRCAHVLVKRTLVSLVTGSRRAVKKKDVEQKKLFEEQCTSRYHDVVAKEYRRCSLKRRHRGLHYWKAKDYSGGVRWKDGSKMILFIG